MTKNEMPSMPEIKISENEKPEIETVETKISNKVKLPQIPKRGIEVVAIRSGFFNQHRKKEGDKFYVSNFNSLGQWMKCIDPVLEKKRIDFFDKKKKEKNNLFDENEKLRKELEKLYKKLEKSKGE